jgi:hypothetical protein
MLKFHRLDRRTGEIVEANPCLMSFGLTEVALPVIAGLLVDAGVGAATAGTIASVATPALINAGIGAAGSAIMGGDPGQGALMGGIGGAAGPLSGAISRGFAAPVGAQMGGNWAGWPGAASAPAGALQVPPVVGPTQSVMDDGTIVTNPAPGGAPMPTQGQPSAPGMGQSPLAAQSAKVGSGLSGPLSVLAAVIQNANRPSTTAPQGATASHPWAPSGYLNRSSVPNYATAPGTNYYTYGQQAQPQFYSGNQLHFAHGGALSRAMAAGHYSGGGGALNTFSTGGGQNYVEGDGAGQEDNIDARLSPGEYVMDASTVSRLGEGNSEEGARRLDKMREMIAHDTGAKQVVQNKPRSPLEYLREAA